MPSRNTIKEYVPDAYYHVYARGASKQKIFIEAADYHYFLGLFDRYLSILPQVSKTGEIYPNYNNRISVIAYCLMSNHFHLLIHQKDIDDIKGFMKSLMTSYSRYFNLKFKKSGSLFESRYKAVRIDSDQYLQHITRYIHLNPRRWNNYSYSSLKFYKKDEAPKWLNTKPVLSMFYSQAEYVNFVADYEEMRDMLAELKYQLADQ